MNKSHTKLSSYEALVRAEKALKYNPPEMKSNFWFGFSKTPATALAISMTCLLLCAITAGFIGVSHIFDLPTPGLTIISYSFLVLSALFLLVSEAIPHIGTYLFPERSSFQFYRYQELQEEHCASILNELNFDRACLRSDIERSIQNREITHSLFMTLGVLATFISFVGVDLLWVIKGSKNYEQTILATIIVYGPLFLAFIFQMFFNLKRISRLKRLKMVLTKWPQ